MIVLDTNVISELARDEPHASVSAWFLEAHSRRTLALSVMSLAELHEGVARQPEGARKARLHQLIFERFLTVLAPIILPCNDVDAAVYGEVHARAREVGEQLSVGDAIIAANTITHRAVLATRDRQLLRLGRLPVLNPWDPTTWW